MGFPQPAGELSRLTGMVSSKRSTQVHFEDINYDVDLKSKNKKNRLSKTRRHKIVSKTAQAPRCELDSSASQVK